MRISFYSYEHARPITAELKCHGTAWWVSFTVHEHNGEHDVTVHFGDEATARAYADAINNAALPSLERAA